LIGFSAVFLLLLGLPLIALLWRSLDQRAWEQAGGAGIPEALLLSWFTSLITVFFTLLLGTPLAYVLARWRFPGRRWVTVLVELPVVLPPAVAGLGLLLAFGRVGLLGPALAGLGISLPFTTAAVVIAQTFVAAPFYIRAAQVGFAGVDQELEDAGRVDGAGGLRLFWYITLPLTRRALAAGLALSWARAMGEFGATILFAGSLRGRTQPMSLLVYNIFERNLDGAVWAGVLLIVMALAALALSRWLTGESDS
jgi:molybdate transport system permease protein